MAEFFIPSLLLAAGLALLLAGGELLVRGASKLAVAAGISPLVVGLTVVAMATSSPELAVSLQSSLDGQSGLGVGNIVGSNIFNVLFILGISALIAPLLVSSRLVWLDVPLMIGVSFLTLALGWDGRISTADGVMMFAGLIAYVVWTVRQSRRETAVALVDRGREATAHASRLPNGAAPPGPRRREWLVPALLVVAGIGLLTVGARLMVDGGVAIARGLAVSDLMIGLTILAIGTSLPEVAASVVATLRGERDMAVGNIVGSNIFNLLGVLALSAVVLPEGIEIPPDALQFDLPVMIAVAVACLPIFFTGHLIARWEGGLFFVYYLIYMTYLILDATHQLAARRLAVVTLTFVIPLTAVTLLVGVGRAWARRQQSRAARLGEEK